VSIDEASITMAGLRVLTIRKEHSLSIFEEKYCGEN
jgi:hypothetical protein